MDMKMILWAEEMMCLVFLIFESWWDMKDLKQRIRTDWHFLIITANLMKDVAMLKQEIASLKGDGANVSE